MAELKHLDSPKMDESQAISLITKHFPIAIQAYIQTTQEKKFLNIWEKLGELENNHSKQNTTEQQTTTSKQAFSSQYGRTNDNQAQPSTSRYVGTNGNQMQQYTGRYAQMNTPHQTGSRQTTLQSANGTNIQNQYTPTQGAKTIKCISTRDDVNNDSANEDVEKEIYVDDPKNRYREGMATEDQ